VLVGDISSHEIGLIHLQDEFPIDVYVQVESAIDVNGWRKGTDAINLNRLTTAGKEDDGILQLIEDILDLVRVKAALSGDVLSNFVYLCTVVKLNARNIGFNGVDSFNHCSPQRVYFEAPAILESSLEVCCEKG